MPGWLAHTKVFEEFDKQVFGVILPDFLAFIDAFDWDETHDLKKALRFHEYLKKNDKKNLWLSKSWISHLILDQIADENKKLSFQKSVIARPIKKILHLRKKKIVEISDLVLDIVMDSLLQKTDSSLSLKFEKSLKKVDIERVADHFSVFFKKDKEVIFNALDYLLKVDFGKVTSSLNNSIDGFLAFYGLRRKTILTRTYGLFLKKMIKKHKREIREIEQSCQKFLLTQFNHRNNMQIVLDSITKEHKKRYQKVI